MKPNNKLQTFGKNHPYVVLLLLVGVATYFDFSNDLVGQTYCRERIEGHIDVLTVVESNGQWLEIEYAEMTKFRRHDGFIITKTENIGMDKTYFLRDVIRTQNYATYKCPWAQSK